MKLRKLLKQLTGSNDIRVLKAYILNARINRFNADHDFRLIIKDRLTLFFLSLCFPLFVRIRKHRNSDLNCVLIEPSNNPIHVREYSYFIKKNRDIDVIVKV